MLKRSSFIEKLLKRLDRIDKESLRNYVVDLGRENELYEEMFNELQEGVLVVTPEGDLLWINQQAALWLGMGEKGPTPFRIFDRLPDTEFARFLQKHLNHLKGKMVEDFHLLTPREMDLRVSLIPLEIPQNKKILVLLANRTEQKNQEIDMDRIARIEALISLAAGVAHEIGNPLNSLSIHLQLLKKEIKDLPLSRRKVVENSLAVMNTEAARLDRIVKNFLRASRKPPLRFRLEDLNDVLEQALQLMEPEMRKNHVELSLKTDQRLPFFLMDRERLFQTFMNLIKNAIEAMPKGGLFKITVSHRENVAVVRFEDQGRGIDERDLPHIFDAYYTTKEEGSGLGLMTVFNTVSEHGGRIDVESKVRKGTTFTLFLPIRQPKLQLPRYEVGARK
jgi:signal transduction histidine kinase